MIKKLIPLLVVALAASCAQLEYEQDAAQVLQDETIETVYHPATNTVLARVSEESRLISTKAEDATHYAVKFFPKSTNELFTLIRAENVMTSYYPFGYTPTNLSRSESTSDSEVFDENPYTETYTNPDDPEDEFVTTLPVVYAYWPIDMPLPQEIECEVCYSVIMPESDTSVDTNTRSVDFIHQYPLYIRSYDSKLGSYVPMRNVKVRMTYDLVSADLLTDSNGYVLVDPILINVTTFQQSRNVTLTIKYETSKWIISNGDTTTPIHIPLGTISYLWPFVDLETTQADPYYLDLSSATKECEIHRAVDFYHTTSHPLASYIEDDEEGIVLHAMNTSDSSRAETDTLSNALAIIVYNNTGTHDTQNNYIGSIIHELGHVHHYYRMDCDEIGDYTTIERKLRESYASYVGWLLGELYYTSKGYIKTGVNEDICTQNRQTWYYDSTGDFSFYTPFFIDLIDQYNQYKNGTTLPVDLISDVPISVIEYMGANFTTMSQCKTYLQSGVGEYYTASELSTYLSFY